ncbi:zinc finger protein OZF-like [Galleria mellonella]|uniref:Zinc finger protein OZF-like n=1 Tax=Galleria mellonella TaxID=7137 RepID=A0A6J1W8N8_GALME|nr:zinc finger protein OZF-like [Galleria mellonella]
MRDPTPSSDASLQFRHNLIKLLTVLLENTTAMPFRWCANKYMCFFCCCTFIDSSKLKEHTREEHQSPKLKNVLKRCIRNSTIKLDISEIACKKCPKTIKNLDDFLEHAAVVHELVFNREVSAHVFTFKLSDEGMNCHECGQSFRFFGPLLKHAHRYHNKSSPFLCEICGRGFVGRANVDSHIKHTHSGTQNQCKKCQDVFPTLHSLKTHYEKVHKRMKCPKCPEVLGSRYLRKRHLALVHDVQTSQFHCDECPRMFTEKSKLVQHKSRIHLKEKTVTCEICGFKVFNKESLRRHMVRHDDSRPFECEICKKAFQRKKTLDFHRRIHTNDKRYVCKDCGKAFVQVTSLKLHIRVHHSTINESTTWN